MAVKKTSIYLEESLDQALALRAAEEGVTKAELIRRTLAAVVERPRRPRLSVGVYKGPVPPGFARDDEEWLARTGFGED